MGDFFIYKYEGKLKCVHLFRIAAHLLTVINLTLLYYSKGGQQNTIYKWIIPSFKKTKVCACVFEVSWLGHHVPPAQLQFTMALILQVLRTVLEGQKTIIFSHLVFGWQWWPALIHNQVPGTTDGSLYTPIWKVTIVNCLDKVSNFKNS